MQEKPRFVRDSGPRDAIIGIIGEAPGGVENRRGRPFLGPAGSFLTQWLTKAGLNRLHDCWITNTYPYQPPGNQLALIPFKERQHWVRKLHERIAEQAHLRVLVPMGNYALQALCPTKLGITKHRGSVYTYTDLNGRVLKVIPSIHPAAIFCQKTWERRCILDWQFIARESKTAKVRRRKRNHIIKPTLTSLRDYVHTVRRRVRAGKVGCLMFDIETPVKVSYKVIGHTKKGIPKRKKIKGERFIACIAFAYSADESFTIPTTKAYWKTQRKLDRVWQYIQELLLLDCDKGTQGDWFDVWHLKRRGLKIRRWIYDTKALHHCLVPNDSHDLGYMVSIDTDPREPYFKDEGKNQQAGLPLDLDTYYRYNGKDAACQWELWDTYVTRLQAANKLDFYHRHYAALFKPVLEMSLEGMRTNEKRRKARHAELLDRLVALRAKLRKWAGVELWGPKGSLSSPKLQAFLYGTLGVPPQTKWDGKKRERVVTSNEVAVRKVLYKYGEDDRKVRRACEAILDFRRVDTLKKFYADKVADPDGRVRASYSFTPVTGRFSSSENPMGRGWNAQNPDREARDFVVPDVGHLFLEVDLSQAESRIVYVLTGDKELCHIARLAPWEFDVHKLNASRIFTIPEDAITKDQRYLGKRTVHAGHYGMQGETLAEVLLKDGYIFTKEDCQQLIDGYLDWRAPVREVFQTGIKREIMDTRLLSNSWGRSIHYQYERMGPDLFRSGFAQIPQSEVPDLLNQWGLIPARRRFRPLGVRLRNQVHDSLLYSTPPAVAWELWQFLQASLERPRQYRISPQYKARTLTIPVTAKLSLCWATDAAEKAGDVIDFKKPPTKREFDDAVQQLLSRRRELRRAVA